jgi:hypothetical protein
VTCALVAGGLVFSLAVVGSAQKQTPPPAPTQQPSVRPPLLTNASTTGFDTIVKPFLAENCFPCHGEKKHKKDLNFEAITSAKSLIDDRERWEEVVVRLRHREMPPDDEPQPPEHQRQAVAGWLSRELTRIDRATPPDPGRVTARRLNRAEYDNTIRDLLGVDLHPADDFPQDDSGYGFDNIGDVLSLSPALMEKYFAAAEKVTRTALFGPPKMAPTLTRLRSDGRRQGDAQSVPATYDVTGLSMPNAFHAIYRAPVDGEYAIKIVMGGTRPAASEPVTVSLWIDEREVEHKLHDPDRAATFSDDRQDFGGQTTEMRVQLTAGDHRLALAIPRIYEGLPARYNGPNPSTRPEPPAKTFHPPSGASPERIEQLKKRFDDTQAELAKLPLNGVRVGSVEIGGPYTQTLGPSRASLDRIYTCGHTDGHHQRWCVSRIMTDLACRAYRRPVSAAEVEKLVALVHQAQDDEDSFDEGLAVGIEAMLVSPDFLFRIEHDHTAPAPVTSYPISQHELATRLSYFLWSSMPDAELRRAADAGTLRDPQILSAQVRRMLRDPKVSALAENFGGQWLQFRALESVTRDKTKFPDFEDYLRLSMRRETELFVEHVIRDDRSIMDFLGGRYSYLNERLAQHYGIPNVVGPEFRQVDLSGSPRAGVLTQGSVLTVSSYATRTSPVLRGKWILENLLNAPPPEPPPNVPNLNESEIGTARSMRQQLEAHRKDPTCAACHRRMDPLGFGLENFDAVGAWRTMDGKFDIDATGFLPDGDEFNGPDELRAILEKQPGAFARCLTSKLMTYALGRGLERYDSRTVRQIAAQLPAQKYRFSALVFDIVNSLPFQSRRPAGDVRGQQTGAHVP